MGALIGNTANLFATTRVSTHLWAVSHAAPDAKRYQIQIRVEIGIAKDFKGYPGVN
jgi:hypothetical protein